MKFELVLFALAGFTVGSLPDDSVVWSVVKFAFALLLFALMWRVAERWSNEH